MILEPLNYTAVRKRYMDIFELDMEAAGIMAGLTKGYPFAFQVLGYLYWENRETKTIKEILPEYDQYLEEYRLKNKGIIDTRTYGEVSFALPRFAEFIQTRMF